MIALLFLLAAAEPAEPATGPVQQLKQKVVEAIRNCPKPKDGEIVVCSRDRGIAEAYRLPRLDPRFATRDTSRQALAQDGARGATPCDRVGAAGAMGCAKQDYDAWGDWKRARKAEDDWSR